MQPGTAGAPGQVQQQARQTGRVDAKPRAPAGESGRYSTNDEGGALRR